MVMMPTGADWGMLSVVVEFVPLVVTPVDDGAGVIVCPFGC
jgi:hypothetical protein